MKRGRIHLQAFSGAKSSQLNHYVIPTFQRHSNLIHVGINDILWSKDISGLKDLPKNLMQLGTTCQSYEIDKVYVSSILPPTRTSFNVGWVNEVIKELCHKSNFDFIDHQNITSNDLWVDGIHLTNSGKAILTRDFAEKVSKILCQNSNFLRSFIRWILQVTQISWEMIHSTYIVSLISLIGQNL